MTPDVLTPASDRFLSSFVDGLEASVDDERSSFLEFIEQHNPTLLDFEHVPRLVDVVQRVVDGELRRVIICEPPRYLKTEVFSRLFGAYFLSEVDSIGLFGLVSYGSELAWSISQEAMSYYQEHGGSLDPSSRAKKRWRTAAGGEMWAVGTGGPMLGFGYDVAVLDDPTDPESAHSHAGQRTFREWWPRKFLSRQEPGGRIIVVMQRLSTDDPIDFLLRREVGDGEDLAPEMWHVVMCDEVKSSEPFGEWDGPMGLPRTCTLEPDDRREGEILAPSRFDQDQVEMIRSTSGPYTTASQRQQRPAAPEGDFWQEDWFNEYVELPDDAHDGGWDWDLAYTRDDRNAASAGVRTYRGVDRRDSDGNRIRGSFPIYVDDVDWDWLEFPELCAFIRSKDGPHYIEDKASGKSAEQVLKRENIAVKTVKVQGGDKLARAKEVQPIVSNRRILVKRSVRRRLLAGERQGLLRVTAEGLATGSGDLDVNDGFVQGVQRHVVKRGRRVRTFVPGQNGSPR